MKTCTKNNPQCKAGKEIFAQIAPAYDAIIGNEHFNQLPDSEQTALRNAYWDATYAWEHHLEQCKAKESMNTSTRIAVLALEYIIACQNDEQYDLGYTREELEDDFEVDIAALTPFQEQLRVVDKAQTNLV